MSYEGGFKEGYFHGFGELKWEDGANYKGSWNEGRRYGCGIYTTKEGDTQYYWTIELPDECKCEDSHSDHDCNDDSDHHCKWKTEHELRFDAEKKLKNEEKKEKDATDKYNKEHHLKIDVKKQLDE